jgi:hypothetical protein
MLLGALRLAQSGKAQLMGRWSLNVQDVTTVVQHQLYTPLGRSHTNHGVQVCV